MSAQLPGFDDATLRGHLLTVADTLATLATGQGEAEGVRRLRECATVTARIAQSLGERAPRGAGAVHAELDALRTAEARFAAEQAARAAQGTIREGARSLDTAALERVLQASPAGGPGLRIDAARILSGGRCKLTASLRIAGAVALPERLILRQDWEGGATETTVADEFRLLALLADAGLMVPRPYHLEGLPNAAGLPFMLVQEMPGRLEAGLFEPPPHPELADALARQLARLHAIPLTEARRLGLSEAGSSRDIVASLDSFAANHAAMGITSAIVDAALVWLRANIEAYGAERSLIHNDLGFHNCLTDGARLTAVLDWELAMIGHPAADLGYIKHFVGRMTDWNRFLAHYREAGGRDFDPATLRFHTIWNAVRLYGLIMRARYGVATGLVRDIEISHACADNLMLLLLFLGEELAAASPPG